MRSFYLLALFVVIFSLFSCAAPRSVINSGKVTKRGNFRVTATSTGNISTETSKELFGGLKDGVYDLIDIGSGNSPQFEGPEGAETLTQYTKPLLMYSIDPNGIGFDFGVKYGVYDRFDVGLKYASSAWVFETMFQFLGPIDEKQDVYEGLYGSFGFQISEQSYELPSIAGLDKLQDLLGYEFSRFDFLFPVIFSKSFGKNEKYGAVGFGAAYNLSKLHYGFEESFIAKLFKSDAQDAGDVLSEYGVHVPEADKYIHSFGGFVNVKAGYKYIYAVVSLGLYYQNYGKYKLFTDDAVSFSGLSIVPSVGIVGEF